jgi:CPA1 family monovalent cation:H+ antiporter
VAALIVVGIAIVVLVTIANRINVAYPIVLVLGGMVIGYIPGVPTFPLPPDLVLVVFLPPLLYWESLTAPTSEFRSSAIWIFQMAFGLVIVTTVVVAVIAHAVIPAMGWGVAFVLGAIVSSTDEVAFAAIADELNVPRHLIGTIEGESLVNDATSLILYGVGIAAVVGASFSFVHTAGALVVTVAESVILGAAAAGVAVVAWRALKEDTLQATISVLVPFLSYLPAYYIGASGVLATVTSGLVLSHFTPNLLQPRARELLTGFWTTVVFLLNAFIFTEVGIRFHSIVSSLHYSFAELTWWSVAVAGACVVTRLVWTFAQGLLPITNEPEHARGKPDWSHVALLAWTGMRGGVSLAAALAIPLETVAGPFPYRDLLIFLTFIVLLVTLIGQGGTLPWIIRRLHIKDDGEATREERLALRATAHAGLDCLERLRQSGKYPQEILDLHRRRLQTRVEEFGDGAISARGTLKTTLFREAQRELLEAQRAKLIELRARGKIDNTVLRRLQRVFDLQSVEISVLDATGQPDLEE